MSAHRMIGNELRVTDGCADAFGDCAVDKAVAFVLDRSVAAHDPDDWLIFVPVSDPFAIHPSVFRCEDLRTFAPLLVNLVAPCWQKTDVDPEFGGAFYDEVDVLKVFFTRLGGIIVRQRSLSLPIECNEAAELRDGHGLDDVEALARAVLEIDFRLLAREAVKYTPG